MGTRADFYIGRGKDAQWLGSIAWDGYPGGNPAGVCKTTTLRGYKNAVTRLLNLRDDATRPEDGWPWPWDTSHTTDYAYAFEDGKVWVSLFGHDWFDAAQQEPEKRGKKLPSDALPNMAERKAVTFSRRSGLLVVSL